MTTSEILRAAAASVRIGPWGGGTIESCALGHIASALGIDRECAYNHPEVIEVAAFLSAALGLKRTVFLSPLWPHRGVAAVAEWNDSFFYFWPQRRIAKGMERAADRWDALHPDDHAPAIVWTMREDVTAWIS